jgi:dihydroorotate dehydrogenase electron transfer subunit
MDLERIPEKAPHWPRGFFMALDQLERQIQQAPGTGAVRESLESGSASSQADLPPPPAISTFEAEVLANIQVGGETSRHYKIRFRAPGLKQVSPGQFVMMDTHVRESVLPLRTLPWDLLAGFLDLKPRAYLKRPFGIHRIFYPGFEAEGFARLSLPPVLAPVLELPFPEQFDIFYKVLEQGVGTREMLQLRKGDRLQMVGPLGQSYNVGGLRRRGVEEVHLIGGGVGMAPLISTAQILRFQGFRVKAFIGMEAWESLRYFDDIERSFGEDPRAAYIYVDELKEAGVAREDLFVSCDRKGGEPPELPIPPENYLSGFSSALYQRFLEASWETVAAIGEGRVAAFTCGPMPMMKAVRALCRAYRIPLQVLMEKRMACGVGVCLSCVCRTITPEGKEEYSRVCSDGPIFDADQLKWN